MLYFDCYYNKIYYNTNVTYDITVLYSSLLNLPNYSNTCTANISIYNITGVHSLRNTLFVSGGYTSTCTDSDIIGHPLLSRLLEYLIFGVTFVQY